MTQKVFGSKQGRSAALFFVLLLILAGHSVFAEAPMAKNQVPGYYRMMLGQFEVTALYDGSIAMDAKLLHNTSTEEIKTLFARAYINGSAAPGCVNAYLINTGAKLVLVDVGTAKLFGPGLGKMIENLKASGYDPAQIDAVFITHLHGDHFGGLLDAAGKLAFPNAVVYVAKPENDFWLSPETAAKAPTELKMYFKMAVDTAAPCLAQGRWKTVADGDTPVQGIKAILTPGHTPGHTVYEITSGDQKLLVIGDIIHIGAVQFSNPKTSIDFDTDQKQAVVTRLALFKKLSSDGTLVAGVHLPFPGLGHLRADGPDTYAWVPVQYGPVK